MQVKLQLENANISLRTRPGSCRSELTQCRAFAQPSKRHTAVLNAVLLLLRPMGGQPNWARAQQYLLKQVDHTVQRLHKLNPLQVTENQATAVLRHLLVAMGAPQQLDSYTHLRVEHSNKRNKPAGRGWWLPLERLDQQVSLE